MRSLLPLSVALFLAGCPSADKDVTEDTLTDTASLSTDADGDGYDASEDCDDNNSLVHPGAPELCDGADNNCNGTIDEDVTSTFYADADSDGFGDSGAAVEACEAPAGTVPIGNDCDDSSDTIFPGAEEVCDGDDNDCDGDIDEGLGGTWYPDLDQDGYGDADAPKVYCTETEGYVENAQDCDDTEPGISPEATEVCNEVDDDCDGDIDEGTTSTFYVDADADGYGLADDTTDACALPAGYAVSPGDCDDTRADVRPDAQEVCNGLDDDCDTLIDDADDSLDSSTGATFYADSDGDGYGDASSSTAACTQPSGYTSDDTDCDDTSAAVSPAATEVCNSVDDDCDGDVDLDATDKSTFYADDDGDGYGDASSGTAACTQPSGHTSDDTDCDDANAAINPGAAEVCNSTDDDCDGLVDDDDSSLDTSTASVGYADDDGDGFGDAADAVRQCVLPSGYISDSDDCDDSDAAISPDASEVCNSIDDDCDGLIDDDDDSLDASAGDTYYADTDLDGYGDADDAVAACAEPSGYVEDDTDCDDGDTDVNPAATDECDGVDNDCSGDADDTGLCPCDVEHYGGDPYMFCDSTKSWSSAESYCDGYDYHFVTIDDATEDAWLDTTADSYSTQKWWIGYNDVSTEGTWVWSDGSSSSYTNWHSGEPNNSGNEDCGQLNRYTDGSWNDEPCGSSFRFICEAN